MGRGTRERVCNSQEKRGRVNAERGGRSSQSARSIAHVSTNEICRFVICKGSKLVNDPATNHHSSAVFWFRLRAWGYSLDFFF